MADVVDIPEFRAFYYTDDTPRQFYTLRRYEDESGSGEMHCYNIAPGIQLSFNDLNLSSCYQPLNVQKDLYIHDMELAVVIADVILVMRNSTLIEQVEFSGDISVFTSEYSKTLLYASGITDT